MKKRTLPCGFADENERSPFLAILSEMEEDLCEICGFYLAKKISELQ